MPLLLMICCQREANLYIPFLKNVSSFDAKNWTSARLTSSSFLNFLQKSKNFVRIKTSDNRRVLCPGNMAGATEFLSLLLQFFDESLKQCAVWRYRGAVSCSSYSTLPASFFGSVFKLSSCWQYFSELSFSFGFKSS